MLSFRGRVSLRSSVGSKGPPGETLIATLNPQRTVALLRLTGWPRIEPGTMNVECDEQELTRILDHRSPDWFERPETVVYPDRYRGIPAKRGGYRYFIARLCCGSESTPVVVRRAVNPLVARIEVYAAEHLRQKFALSANDEVELVFDE